MSVYNHDLTYFIITGDRLRVHEGATSLSKVIHWKQKVGDIFTYRYWYLGGFYVSLQAEFSSRDHLVMSFAPTERDAISKTESGGDDPQLFHVTNVTRM